MACDWVGYAYELLGNLERARESYRRARGASRNIPLIPSLADAPEPDVPGQVREIYEDLFGGLTIRRERLTDIDRNLAPLSRQATTAEIEEAVRCLGEHLGLTASRPENEYGTGPDVLWELPGFLSLCFEVKSDKARGSSCRKSEIGQLRDHIQWIQENRPVAQVAPIFVGPYLPPSRQANPGTEIVVIEIATLEVLSRSV